ncbi:hypothetical protein MRX96_024520 [Rhipicephalus microplus]
MTVTSTSRPLMWTQLFKWVEWDLSRHRGSLRALQQQSEALITMLPTFELSIYRAEEPPAAGLTKKYRAGLLSHQLPPISALCPVRRQDAERAGSSGSLLVIKGSLRALQQHAEPHVTMLPTFELSIYRAEEPPAAGLTKNIVQAFSRINFHRSAPCVLFGAKMQKGRKWLPFAISDIRSALTTQVSLLPTHWPQRAYVSFLHLRLARHASLARSILKGMEITKPIVVKSPVFGSSQASRGWLQNETILFLGCCDGGQPFVRVFSRTLATSAWEPFWSELQQLPTYRWTEIPRGKYCNLPRPYQ